MVGCAAYNCFNNSSNKSKNQETQSKKKIAFHKFPKEESIRKKWIDNLRLENFVSTPHSRLSQERFSSHCYQRSPELLKSLGLENERLILKEGAVPTVFNRGSPKGKKQAKGRIRFKANPLKPSSPKKSFFGSPKKKQGAYEKRKRRDVSMNICFSNLKYRNCHILAYFSVLKMCFLTRLTFKISDGKKHTMLC